MTHKSIRLALIVSGLFTVLAAQSHADMAHVAFTGTLQNVYFVEEPLPGMQDNCVISGTLSFDLDKFTATGNSTFVDNSDAITYTANDGQTSYQYTAGPGIQIEEYNLPYFTAVYITSLSQDPRVTIIKQIPASLVASDLPTILKSISSPLASGDELFVERFDLQNNVFYRGPAIPASIGKIQITQTITRNSDGTVNIQFANVVPNAGLKLASSLTGTNFTIIPVVPTASGTAVKATLPTTGLSGFTQIVNTNSP